MSGVEVAVVVSVIHCDAVHHLCPAAQPLREQDIPHTLGARPVVVTVVVDSRMAIVHLEKTLPLQCDEVLDLDGPPEVGMVDVGEHRLTGSAALIQHRVDVVLHHLPDTPTALRLDQLGDVGGVHVNWLRLEAVRDLFTLDQEEAANLLEPPPVLLESFQTGEKCAIVLTLLYPVRPELFQIVLECRHAACARCNVDPSIAFGERVVVRQGDEIVTLVLVPADDGLGIVVPVAPEGVCVKVALPPPKVAGLSAARGECCHRDGKNAEWERRPRLHGANMTPKTASRQSAIKLVDGVRSRCGITGAGLVVLTSVPAPSSTRCRANQIQNRCRKRAMASENQNPRIPPH